MQTLTLRNGIQMPILGYGVYRVSPEETEQCVLDALATGFRHIDTAQSYFNEREVGNAIRKSGIPRNEPIFPMSRNKAHMADNLHLFDFELTDGEMAQIAALDKGRSAFFSHQDPAIVEWFGQMVEERKKQGHHPASEKKAW